MKIKIICVLLSVLLILPVTLIPRANEEIRPRHTENINGELYIEKAGHKLKDGETLSRIDSRYLKKSEDINAGEKVTVTLALEDAPVIDECGNLSVASYLQSFAGKARAYEITKKQDSFSKELKNAGLIDGVEHGYLAIINGLAVSTTYGRLKKLERYPGVKDVIYNEKYLPMSDETDGPKGPVVNDVDVYPTGIYNSGSVKYTGLGTSVAILDSGFDCSHEVFSRMPGKLMFEKSDIEGILGETVAKKSTPDLSVRDVWRNEKIPFAYDYADKDTDVFPYDSGHGTHVAGIIGGKSDEITGIAVDTQLILMKVFKDLDSGADTDDILAALEDAVLLNVDVINLSLGSSCGFATRYGDKEQDRKVNAIYEKIGKSGISLLTAASNSYSSGWGGKQGNTNMVTNPDSGTVGSPSTYEAALSVASISGTKSRYLVANGGDVIFYDESNAITGKPNDFFKELMDGRTEATYEYVAIPGIGSAVNYRNAGYEKADLAHGKKGSLDGKIALVRRGTNTFEEKAETAKKYGAAACVIYNNIDGDVLMSMGKKSHIPTISVSKDDGMMLAAKKTGTITLKAENMAGPFMSDFSSWGPTPSLTLKPEITAHGGNIRSSVPGGYEEMSGTSMATPNLCGVVVLIRQYIKDNYPALNPYEAKILANRLLMSTATIAENEDGNPYSPRKQGAGLASLKNAVSSGCYITVEGTDKSKLELFDDPGKTGVYDMKFDVVNLRSDRSFSYGLSSVCMTESVSKFDEKHVAERPEILETKAVFKTCGKEVSSVTVPAGGKIEVEAVITLSEKDKEMMDGLFPYGMYAEGYIKLKPEDSKDENAVHLNVPFLAFYGDWEEAPLFDRTFYEVESEAHDNAIDEEDKLKADYYATTPYGSYLANYMIPLGTYIYGRDEERYDALPASADKIAISDVFGTIDGISTVFAGLLRNAKEMQYNITDRVTGESVYDFIDYNATKAFSNGGEPVPYYEFIKFRTAEHGLVNNRKYSFSMTGLLDYGDGGELKNARNSFGFDFYMDNEAPVIREARYEKEYRTSDEKDHYYIDLILYDNHYVQSVTPVIFTSEQSYVFLSKHPVPVYGKRGEDCKVRIEITDYLKDTEFDKLMQNGMAFSVDDYALNSDIFICRLPGTKEDFRFTKDGSLEGRDLRILSANQGEAVDAARYLAAGEDSVRDYLRYLSWSSSDESVAAVRQGLVKCIRPGKATITVTEHTEGKKAAVILNVRKTPGTPASSKDPSKHGTEDYTAEKMESLRFSRYETLFAFPDGPEYSAIGKTGDTRFVSASDGLTLYPGEKIKLLKDFEPWFAEDNYDFAFKSGNPARAIVTEDGVVEALEEGKTIITAEATEKATGRVSNIMASIDITVKSPFIIKDRALTGYKGFGDANGAVTVPSGEGIIYIDPYAFCLYETDVLTEITDDDFDLNKIPKGNDRITSVIIPEGVEEIKKYAFYNCPSLKSVVIPDSVKIIREYAFKDDVKLETADLNNTEVAGAEAFSGCKALKDLSMDKIYALGERAFYGCESLELVNLENLRNAGKETFLRCKGLKNVALSPDTKLSHGMFAVTGLEIIDILPKGNIPELCFNNCENLTEAKLPDYSDIEVGNGAFYGCKKLSKVIFKKNTDLKGVFSAVFKDCAVTSFEVDGDNPYYAVSEDGRFLTDKKGETIRLAAPAAAGYDDLVIESKYTEIGQGAFSGLPIKSLTFMGPVKIGEYAFSRCDLLEKVTFYEGPGTEISDRAFENSGAIKNGAKKLEAINLEFVKSIGCYAFAESGIEKVILGCDTIAKEGAFMKSSVSYAKIGENSELGLGAFQFCTALKTADLPESDIKLGEVCFAGDTALEGIDLSFLTVIERQAFYDCRNLKEAVLSSALIIGDHAFADCSKISVIEIPQVKKIGEGAFSRSREGSKAPAIKSLVIPETAEKIGKGAFLGCESLVNLKIYAKTGKIEDFAFMGCFSLREVTLSQDIEEIGERAFAYSEAIVKIDTIGSDAEGYDIDISGVKRVKNNAFSLKAERFSDVKINAASLEEAGDFAFSNVSAAKFEAPNLKVMGKKAFENCRFEEFGISLKIGEVKGGAFYGCKNLKSFYYLKDGKKETSGNVNGNAKIEGGALYTKAKSKLWQFTALPALYNVNTDGEEGVFTVAGGTARAEAYAAYGNLSLTKLVLPDGLKAIGDRAFYRCDNLKTVVFNSVKAPALENFYDKDAELESTDPGYETMHGAYELFGYELCYYNFKDLAGRTYPISMVLPLNEDIKGYDSPVYLAYFGKAEIAKRSGYTAMEEKLIEFIDYVKDIAEYSKKGLTLSHEKLVNDAVTAYKALKQSGTDYGITKEDWDGMVNLALGAKKKLDKIKLSLAGKEVKELQEEINALPGEFEVNLIPVLKKVSDGIKQLKPAERSVLDLSGFETLKKAYDSYRETLENETAALKKIADIFGGGAL